MTLYEIEEGILGCVDTETGEIIDTERLGALQMERDRKVQNVALWVKCLEAEAAAYRAEKESFARKQKAAEGKAESLRAFLSSYLGGTPFRSMRVSISFRRSESVRVTDIGKLPDGFLRHPVPEADKAAIRDALKAGVPVEGAELAISSSIQIR